MKIGIITYHNAHNYGAMLQAYALRMTLLDMGHNVEFVHFFPAVYELKNKRKLPVINIRQAVVRLVVALMSPLFKKRYLNFEAFRREYLPVTKKRYGGLKDLINHPPEFDAIVAGSDQIWNMENGGDPAFFLQFPTGKARKVAYAPSFGRDEVPVQYHGRLSEWLTQFDVVSVRESSGVEIIKSAAGKTVPQVLDPVFLLKADAWRCAAKSPAYRGEYIAFYSLEVSRELSDLVEAVSQKLNLPVVILGKGGRFILRCKTKMAIDSGPAEFLGWLKDASFVITNSFHATAFSIIFKKPFYTIPHSTRNARMESILRVAGLLGRQLDRLETLSTCSVEEMQDVDFTSAEENLELEVDRSRSFLEGALSLNK